MKGERIFNYGRVREGKLYDQIIERDLTYEQACEAMKKGLGRYVSRPEWDGIHMFDITDNDYIIITKEGKVYENPKEVYCKDKNDWIVVRVTSEVIHILDVYYKDKKAGGK